MGETKETKERLTGEERKAKIVDAALSLFAEKGFNGTKTKEIAKAAGISEALIFWYFKSKKEIYQEALRTLFRRHPSPPDIDEKMARKDDFAVFKEFALHVIRHNSKDRRMLRLSIFNALDSYSLEEIITHDGEATPDLPVILSTYITQRIKDGDFQEQDPRIAAQIFVDLIYTRVLDKEASIINPPHTYSNEEMVDNMVRIFVKGLKK